MPTTSERNRTKTICASLIASTMVTADCADETCICPSSIDTESPGDVQPPEAPPTAAAELPLEGKVLFRLEPVISNLPLQSDMAIAMEPTAPAATIDSISQADARYVAQPRSRRRGGKRIASNQNQAQPKSSSLEHSGPSITGDALGAAAAAELESVPQALLLHPAKAPTRELSRRPLLQDAYIAFGANGR